MRKIIPVSILLPVFLLAACGGGDDTAKQQAEVRAAQKQVLLAVQKGKQKEYCALTINPTQNSKTWQKVCLKNKSFARQKQAAKPQLAALPQAKIIIKGAQATVFLPNSAPQQFQLAGEKWLLNVAPRIDLNEQQQTTVRDRTRFYLATVANGDATAYCVVGIRKGENQKECLSRAKAWFKDKKGDYKDVLKLVKQQQKSIDKADIKIDGNKATVETSPESIKLSTDGPGRSWVVVKD